MDVPYSAVHMDHNQRLMKPTYQRYGQRTVYAIAHQQMLVSEFFLAGGLKILVWKKRFVIYIKLYRSNKLLAQQASLHSKITYLNAYH